MNPLELYQRVLMWLCGLPPKKSDGKHMRFAYMTLTLCVIVGHLLSLVAGAIFIYRNVSINLEETLFSLFHTIGSVSMLYSSIATVLLCRKLPVIFGGLSNIYNKSEYEIDLSK